MSKATLPVRGADGSSHQLLVESLPGGKAQLLYVATAIPTVVDFQEVTIGTTQGTLASICSGAALPANATHALFRVKGPGDVFWTDDGDTNPTASLGFPAPNGEWGEWVNLAGIRLIATQASTEIAVSFRRFDA